MQLKQSLLSRRENNVFGRGINEGAAAKGDEPSLPHGVAEIPRKTAVFEKAVGPESGLILEDAETVARRAVAVAGGALSGD